jgi:hypothetical protein
VSAEDRTPPKRDEDLQSAETRLRNEIARERRKEEAQIKAVKIGCSAIIALMVIVMVVMFFL